MDVDTPGARATYPLNQELAAFILGANDSKVLIEVPDLAQFCADTSSSTNREESWKVDSANILWTNKWYDGPLVEDISTKHYTQPVLHYVDLPLVHWLMELGASLDVCISGHALRDTVRHENLIIMEMILKSGDVVDFDARDIAKAWEIACKSGHKEIVQLLLNRYVHSDILDEDGWKTTPLILMIREGNAEVVELLLAANLPWNIDAISENGEIALMAACKGGHVAIAELG